MIESGVVVEVKDGLALVRVASQSGCEKCSAAGFCNYMGENTRVVEVVNTVGAQKGDSVEIGVPSKYTMIAALLIFIVPMVLAIAGVIVGIFLFQTEVAQILGGIIGIVAGILLVKLIDIWVRRTGRLRPRILIIKKEIYLKTR